MKKTTTENEEKPVLSEEELKEWLEKKTYEVKYLGSENKTKIKNTIDQLEAEYKTVKGLKAFITTGVLVNPQIILSANPDERSFDLGMRMTALGGGRYREETAAIVNVNLRVQDVERLIRILPAMLEAARNRKQYLHLKEIYKAGTESRRGW